MEIRQLEEFIDLAKTCNFQETADNLNTSQSNISKHIQKLEDELGVVLFNRTNRTVQINEYGAVFIPHARRIVASSHMAVNELKSMKNGKCQFLNICFHPLLSQYGVIKRASEFNVANPDIALNLIENTNPIELLQTAQCDVAFSLEWSESISDVKHIVFTHDRLAVVLPSGHPLADLDSITMSQLKDEKFIDHQNESNTGQADAYKLHKLCQDAGFSPNVIATVSRTATAARFVKQGLGVSLMFRKQLPDDILGLEVINLVPEIPVNISLYYSKTRELSSPAKLFLNFIKQGLDA